MSNAPEILEYKCPCCNAGLHFSGAEQKLTCEYCGNSFDLDTIKQYNEAISKPQQDEFQWDDGQTATLSQEEQEALNSFVCPACSGELITDGTTAATFCPFCDNPAVLPSRLSGGLKPDAVLPFKTTKEDAKKAFLELCKGKPLLPKDFTSKNRLEKITGMYVPFWLYDCSGDIHGQYRGTKVKRWSDARYHYTKTDYFMVSRSAKASFVGIPMDGSTKMDDTIMESIEPFDMAQSVDFDTAYLTGFLADKYDVEAKSGEERVRQRVDGTFDELLSSSLVGYSSVTPMKKDLRVEQSKARYVLFPVWMLNTKYKDKIYTFAMNGQSGKMTGSLPIDTGKKWRIFAAIAGSITLIVSLIQMLAL